MKINMEFRAGSRIRDDSIRGGAIAGGKYAAFTIDHTADIFTELRGKAVEWALAKPITESTPPEP